MFQWVYETILSRSTRHDGQYYVGIITTGIYCRPSCRSRTPRPENVRVYSSAAEAEAAGFRACKRCKPESPSQHGPDAELAEALTALLEARLAEPGLTLHAMAAGLAISPYHLQRVVKRITGTTPYKQLLELRIRAAKLRLRQSQQPIAEIAQAVGFRTAAHFSYVFQKAVGCAPNEYRHHPID